MCREVTYKCSLFATYVNKKAQKNFMQESGRKSRAADILISECGLPELVPVEFGGTAEV